MNKLTSENLVNLGVSIFAFLLPLGTFLQSIGLGLLVIALLSFLIKQRNTAENKFILLFCVPFLVYLTYWFFAYDINEASNFILRSLPIVITPVLLFNSKNIINNLNFKRFFIYGTVVAVLFCCSLAILGSEENVFQLERFRYYQFASYLSFHPTYFALIVLSALVLLNWEKLFSSTMITMTLSIFLIVTLFLLQIRSSILLLIALCVIKIIVDYKQFFSRNTLILLGLVLIMIFTVLNQKRFSDSFKVNFSNELGTFEEDGVSQRIWLWGEALKKVKDQPVFGYGLRSQRSLFHKQVFKNLLAEDATFRERDSKISNSKKNLHNQYLQWLYDFGFFGLFIILFSFLILIINAKAKGNYLFLVLFTVYLVMLLTENLMDRQAGIYFFGVVLPLIYLQRK